MRCPVNRISIVRGFSSSHLGVDFGYGDTHNQPVYAIDDGIVIYNRWQLTGGYTIVIKHNNGMCSVYGHLLKDSQTILEGNNVKRGQQIAKCGKSGMVTGEHLHLGIYKGSKVLWGKQYYVDPFNYINVYDGQTFYKSEPRLIHTKHVKGVDNPPLLVHNAKNYAASSVVSSFNLKNDDEVETYGTINGMNIIDNVRGYYCSKKYVK